MGFEIIRTVAHNTYTNTKQFCKNFVRGYYAGYKASRAACAVAKVAPKSHRMDVWEKTFRNVLMKELSSR